MEGENVTEPLNTAAPSTGESIFATAPPPSDSVLATASSVSPSSKSQPEQSSMSVRCSLLFLSSSVSACYIKLVPLDLLITFRSFKLVVLLRFCDVVK